MARLYLIIAVSHVGVTSLYNTRTLKLDLKDKFRPSCILLQLCFVLQHVQQQRRPEERSNHLK